MRCTLLRFCFLILLVTGCIGTGSSQTLSFSLPGHTVSYQPDSLHGYLDSSSIHIYRKSRDIFATAPIPDGNHHLQLFYGPHKVLDTTLWIQQSLLLTLHHTTGDDWQELKEVIVQSVAGHKDRLETIPVATLSDRDMQLSRGLSLGESLKSIAGVNSLQSGPNISKPVIHGVYSNRILILNNGVRQEGQNWGNDHAPEIDPFIAQHLSVIKGPASLRYGSDAIGGVVLVEAPPLPDSAGTSGEVNLIGMTNGRSGTASVMFQGTMPRRLPGLSWRILGTVQKAGNTSAAYYYIPNTGYRQQDFSATIGYHKRTAGITAYYSLFNSKTGITPTSEDLTYNDFLAAIARGRPSAALNYFTYDIPDLQAHQTVNHQLFKTDLYWQPRHAGRFDLVAALQRNLRKEFGLDPISNPGIPDNKFDLTTHTINLQWSHPREWIPNLNGQLGIDYMQQQNTTVSRDRYEVIPSYKNHSLGTFWIEKYKAGNVLLEGGLRYDHKYQNAHLFRRGNALDNTVDRYYDSSGSWNRITTNIGATWFIGHHLTAMYNLGTAWRAPAPIELFANGVHQGASRWEVGDPNLKTESAVNNNLSFRYKIPRLDIEAGIYANFFRNYIYILRDSIVQTIAGVYPEYKYKQTPRALFTGLDFTADYEFLTGLHLVSKVSLVRGRNQSGNDWLIYIPADRFDNSLKWETENLGKIIHPFIQAGNLSVLRQSRYPANVSEPPPPPGYNLWNAAIGGTIHINWLPVEISLRGTNLMNKEYKDYLNLFRFYNHDPGRNVILQLRIPLQFNSKS